jgi:hypothetical protein
MITIEHLSEEFEKKPAFEKSVNKQAEALLLDNFNALIRYIESISWQSLASSEKFELFSAVGTIVPKMFQLLHTSYELFKRGRETMSFSLLRTTLDCQDLLHLFFKEHKWAELWYSDENITSAKGDLSPRKVRKILGKNNAEAFFVLFSKYVHPTSRDAHDSFFALVEEEGVLKSARLDIDPKRIKSLHLNLGGAHGEGNDWFTMLFLNTLICRLLNQLDVYLSEFVNPSALEIPFQCIVRLNEFMKDSLPAALLEITTDISALKQACAGILMGSLGDEITLSLLSKDLAKMKKLEKALGLK